MRPLFFGIACVPSSRYIHGQTPRVEIWLAFLWFPSVASIFLSVFLWFPFRRLSVLPVFCFVFSSNDVRPSIESWAALAKRKNLFFFGFPLVSCVLWWCPLFFLQDVHPSLGHLAKRHLAVLLLFFSSKAARRQGTPWQSSWRR